MSSVFVLIYFEHSNSDNYVLATSQAFKTFDLAKQALNTDPCLRNDQWEESSQYNRFYNQNKKMLLIEELKIY